MEVADKTYIYEIVGEARAESEDGASLSTAELESLAASVDCQENFVDYLDRECLSLGLGDILVSGYMTFRFRNGTFHTVTTYTATSKLSDEQIAALIEYTTGQWSDGIGEGFEQEPVNGKGDTISPWADNGPATCALVGE